MLNRKNDIIVGLTTFDNEMLRISVPALARVARKFLLIIFNDNPLTTITRRQVRALGYRGELQIINSDENVGTLRARMAIVAAASRVKPRTDWIIFNDDDDMLLNLDVTPNIGDDNFAILQDAIILRNRIAPLIRAMHSGADNLTPDGTDIILDTPHLGFAGTMIRTDLLIGMCDIINDILPQIAQINDKLPHGVPADALMWSLVNIYAHELNPNAAPIYMHQIGQIITDIDSMPHARARTMGDAVMRGLARCCDAFRDAMAAAPRG